MIHDTLFRARTILTAGLFLQGLIGADVCGQESPSDGALLLHYTFQTERGSVAKDLSEYGNDGQIVKAEYLQEVDGRQGVLRFDGESSYLDCGDAESLRLSGDMSLEMWVRLNRELKPGGAFIFGRNRRDEWFISHQCKI